MKSFVILGLLVLSTSSLASKFNCALTVNSDKVFESNVKVHDGERIKFFSEKQYDLFISQKGESEFELEVLDLDVPSRSYAKSNLDKKDDIIQYSLWSRDILFELKCELL